MKGVLICGGSGTRLRPLTDITNKSLLPVYDKPLLLYPLQTLLDAGIREIAVITGAEHMDQMTQFLGDGSRFGCTFTFAVQKKPGGIAQALGLAEEFAAGDAVCAVLGDNIYFDELGPVIRKFTSGAHVFLKEVPDAERFGVAEPEDNLSTSSGQAKGKEGNEGKEEIRILSIEEKPKKPKSNLAVTGCYLYDNRCFEVIRNMKPSARGELEITDVSRWYLEHGELRASILRDEWIDAGTFESLHRAAVEVRRRKNNE